VNICKKNIHFAKKNHLICMFVDTAAAAAAAAAAVTLL
jgi:hypothetical protein